MPRRFVTITEFREIVRLYVHENMSLRKVAAAVGRSSGRTIERVLDKAGIERRARTNVRQCRICGEDVEKEWARSGSGDRILSGTLCRTHLLEKRGSPEEKAKRKPRDQRYRQSAKGKLSDHNRRKRYMQTEKGKETRRRWLEARKPQ